MEITHQDSPPPDDLPDAPLSHPVKPQRKVTPTERKSSQLPSPPSSSERRRASSAGDELPQRLIDVKLEWQIRGDIDKLTSLPLNGEDFVRLLPELESSFRRFDYEPRLEHITIRMPSRTHDLFSQFISDAIFDALSELGRNDNAVRPLTSRIVKGATSDVDIYVSDSDDKSKEHVPLKRSPDGQFLYADAELPNVVFEVAYSQDPKQLPKLAKGYIHHSWGDIKAVLCFSISKSKESTISVWKPVFYPEADSDEVTMEIEQVVQPQPFRTADGNPINQDHKLVLDLHDFIPDTDCDGYPNPCISIPYSKLYESLLEAERRSKPRRKCSRSKRGVKRSRLSSDSVETMAEEDRKQWNAKDRAARKKQDAEDGDYLELNDEQRPAKRSQHGRACTKPPIVELDSSEAAAS
ncbi:uncharacterized protein FMAN_15295 [Fusarium mangiferae]|uniref:Uncharacterized protein n=1 Tax=Fusarium mangiferae TaxID=192010 RepID=A0A1L7U8U3_FUSMA|nr:uncharacterized protein FMAN_15295 [Fusarium mangiferae]CVL07158.1 uncharacterized protein FMAN_15295 [Fusarium mangiferae]